MALKIIYLAGGCFWGLQRYMDTEVKGVVSTETGYANGKTDTVTYGEVCSLNTGFSETVKVTYDTSVTDLETILKEYYYTIDPTSINRQGADIGSQYRTGIYWTDENDVPVIKNSLAELQKNYKQKIAVECEPLKKYITAEEYHQKYLEKNPTGYCHINFQKIRDLKSAFVNSTLYVKKSREKLEKTLTPIQYSVTQQFENEEPFNNLYWDKFDKGIYADITTGEPLFSSGDKYDAGTGFPAFRKPMDPNVIRELPDVTDPLLTPAAISRVGMCYLGHIYEDKGRKHYSINSAALMFIPENEMDEKGYGYIKNHIKL